MKQTLTELAVIMRAVDAGAQWECDIPEMGWHKNANQGKLALLQLASYGWAIRLKPAEPDAEGWIPWKGGECPVDNRSVVEIKTGIGTVSKRTADALRWRWDWSGAGSDIVAYRIHKEPDPHPSRAEVEEGIKQGRKWQSKPKESTGKWITADVRVLPQWLPDYEYRLKPEPKYIPLGPDDVPPGSVFGLNGRAKNTWHGLLGVYSSTIMLDTTRRNYTYGDLLVEGWQINRSLPLTGKWDPNAWELCRKLKGGDNE